MELVKTSTANVLASYEHESFLEYAAVTRNKYENGTATYLACKVSEKALGKILLDTLKTAGISPATQIYPVVVRKARNEAGNEITFYLNYSASESEVLYQGANAVEIRSGESVKKEDILKLLPWGVKILEETK